MLQSRHVSAALLVLLALACDGAPDPTDGGEDTDAGPEPTAVWTIFVYGHGDHNLAHREERLDIRPERAAGDDHP
jgi:hypothetical protein